MPKFFLADQNTIVYIWEQCFLLYAEGALLVRTYFKAGALTWNDLTDRVSGAEILAEKVSPTLTLWLLPPNLIEDMPSFLKHVYHCYR